MTTFATAVTVWWQRSVRRYASHSHPAPAVRIINMSDDPNQRGGTDRKRLAQEQDHEVQHFVKVMKDQFPKATSDSIRAALAKAKESGSDSREILTQKVGDLLRTKG